MKNPAVLLYTSDFITGTLFMTNEEVGAYIRLLCMQHQKGHLSIEEIKQICKNDNVFNSVIIHFKKDKKELYYNERMDLEKEKRQKYSESRANNRKKKEENNKKDMKKICKRYEKDMENENINENINNNNIYFNNNILNNIFIEYLDLRLKLKCKNTDRAIKLLINELNKYDDNTKIEMINNSIMHSWKSVYPIKEDNKKENNGERKIYQDEDGAFHF